MMAELLTEKAKHVRLLVLDIDGTLTSGTIYYQDHGAEIQGFHIHDGLGLKLLKNSGVATAVISGRHAQTAISRLEALRIEHIYLGQEDKRAAFESLKRKLNLDDQKIAYMGDDLPDLPLLRRAGLSISVPHAPAIIKQSVDLVTKKEAGAGAVREACELIMEAQGQYGPMIQFYLSQ